MSCSFLTDQNFLDAEYINLRTASSEKTEFPASNLYDNNQRSRVWRSDGSFVIDATNKTIVFRETNAVDLTATLTEDRYTSTTALAAEIKSALEAIGASTYTVSINSTTGKWQLISNGTGGDGRFELVWTDPNSAGIATVLGFGVSSDDTGSLTYTGDYLSIHTEEWLLWDFGLPSLPQALYIFGDQDSPIPLSTSATIILEGNHTDNFSTSVYSQAIPYDGRVLSYFNSAGLGSTYLRYWRLKIVDSQNGAGFVQLGFAFLGSVLQPARGAISFGFAQSNVDFSDRVRVVGGQIFANNRAKTKTYNATWQFLTKQDIEAMQDHFERYGTRRVFVISFDQNQAFSTEKERFIRLVRYESEPTWTLVSPNNFTLNVVYQEAI